MRDFPRSSCPQSLVGGVGMAVFNAKGTRAKFSTLSGSGERLKTAADHSSSSSIELHDLDRARLSGSDAGTAT